MQALAFQTPTFVRNKLFVRCVSRDYAQWRITVEQRRCEVTTNKQASTRLEPTPFVIMICLATIKKKKKKKKKKTVWDVRRCPLVRNGNRRQLISKHHSPIKLRDLPVKNDCDNIP